MERLRQGQRDALDELYRRYAAKLYTFCRYTTRTLDAQSIEDLVQDVFLRVCKSAHTFNPRRAAFRTWLFRIARNRCIDVKRRGQRVRMLPIVDRAEQGAGGRERAAGSLALLPGGQGLS
jgi:RNA polymerase sigma-70 factor (ECF subfamily)